MERRAVRRELETLAKVLRGRLEVAAVKRADPFVFLGHGAVQQPSQLHHQRIRWTDLDASPMGEVLFGPCRVSQAPIRQRQRIVNDRGAGIGRERLLESIDGAAIVAFGQSRAAETKLRGHQARLQGKRLHEQRLRALRLAEIEVHAAKPDQRGHVVRPQLKCTLEGGRGLSQLGLRHVHVTQVVGPSHVVRRERLCVQVAGLGSVEVFGGQQKVPQVTVRRAKFVRRRVILDPGRQRPVSVGHLLLDRLLHAGKLGQHHRRQAAFGRYRRGGRLRSGAVFGSDEQAHNIPRASAEHARATARGTLTSLRLP